MGEDVEGKDILRYWGSGSGVENKLIRFGGGGPSAKRTPPGDNPTVHSEFTPLVHIQPCIVGLGCEPLHESLMRPQLA